MKSVDPLLPVALLGTSRAGDVAALLRTIGGAPTPVLEAIAREDATPPPVKLLRAAGVLTQCGRAGFVVPGAPGAPQSAEDEAREEAQRGPDLSDEPPALDGPEWSLRLERVLDDAPASLRHEVLRVIAERGRRLPAALLPAALDLALRDPRLRPTIAAAVGARGRWLASTRPRWKDALGGPTAPTEDDWNHGRITARVAFLRDARARDADAARERLRAELPRLGADERAPLVACLEVGLSPADEAIVDALLVDRAVEVRRIAAALAVRLPGSARARAIAEALAALLARGKRGAWTIDAPPAEHPDAKALGLPARAKTEPLGERAFWLFQLVRNTPLGFWSAHTGMSPQEVVAWAGRTDWASAILRGLHDAILVAGDVAWVSALLDGWNGKVLGKDASHVRALLPWAARERAWCDRLLAHAETELCDVVEEIARAATPERRLGTELGGTLARVLANRAGSPSFWDDVELDAVRSVAAALPDPALDTLRAIPRADGLDDDLAASVDAIEEIVDVRLRLRALAAPDATVPASHEPDASRKP